MRKICCFYSFCFDKQGKISSNVEKSKHTIGNKLLVEELPAADYAGKQPGLLKGDYITVFAPSGQLITQAYSSGASFTTPLPIVSGYVVKVNDHTQKVIR